MKKIQPIIIFILFLFLTACNQSFENEGYQNQNERKTINNSGISTQSEISLIASSGSQPVSSSGVISIGIEKMVVSSGSEKALSGVTVVSGSIMPIFTGMSYTGITHRKKVLEKFDPTLGYDPDNILAITTLDELKKLNPYLTSITGSDDQKFITFQKNQILLSIYGTQIKDPEYKKLQDQYMNIIQGKELWNKEIIDLEKKIEIEKSTKSIELPKLLTLKSKALNDLQDTDQYKIYLKNNQSTLSVISTEMQKFWSPEMKELQKEIDAIRVELYRKK